MVLVYYISGHGFGHASRDIEVIRALVAACPDLQVIVRTTVPAWFFDAIGQRFELRSGEVDTGVAQIDSLTIDEQVTAGRAREFYAAFDTRVAQEAAILRQAGATIVVGDVPPLAPAAALEAGVPSVAIANFTWDWIYEAYPRFEAAAPAV